MSSIDERVVEMKFKDSSFQEGVARTLQGLKDLKNGLKLDGAAKGLEDLGEAADKVDLDGIKNSAISISPLFAALATIGVTALSRLTNAAMDFGKNLISNVMEPLFEGGQRRALNLEGARYSFRMLGIDATQAMNDANYAVEGTAFSLDVAAKAASQLSASQVALGDDMKAALRGISGVAALTNSSYEDISEVFTKVAGQGRLMGDDLNRLGARGMNAAAVLAKAFNVSEEELRKMVSKGQVSFQDFANAMDNAFGAQAVSAAETYSGALGQMKTALARIGADIAAPKLEALRRIYNALAPAINGVKFAIQPLLDMFGEFQTMRADGIVAMLEDIVKVGFGNYKEDANSPLVALQQGFRNIAESILNVVRPIREAWNQVFPPALGGMISKFSFWFRDFTGSLKITGEAAAVIKDIFVGLFSVLKIGFQIIGGVLGFVFNGLSLFFQLLSAIGGVIAPVIEFVYNFVTGLKLFDGGVKNSTNAIDTFFNALKWAQNFVLEPIIGVLKGVGDALNAFLNEGKSAGEVFGKLFEPVINVAKKIAASFGIAGDIVEERFGVVGERIRATWEYLGKAVQRVGEFFKPIAAAMGTFFSNVRDGFAKMFEGADFNTILAGVNTVILGILSGGIYKAITGLIGAFAGAGSFKESFLGAIDGITETFGAMQKSLRADAILKIALAIGVMALSLGILAMIEPERLISAAAGLGVAATILMTAMNTMSGVLATKGLIKMPLIAYAMILLGTALTIISIAVKNMAGLEWDELLRGLAGFAVVLGGLLISMKTMSGLSGPIFKAAAAMVALSVALLLITASVAILGKMKMETLIQGLIGVTTAILVLSAAAIILSANAGGMTKASGGILAMATALGMLTGVIAVMGLLPWPILLKGMGTLAVLLAGLTVVATVMSANAGGMTKAAGGILAMATAIGLLVVPILLLGMMNLGTLIQGLVGVAAAIAILVVAAKAAIGIEKGAAGLIALSAALLILSVGLKIMSTIPLEGMLIALLGLGALLIMLGFAGTVLGPVAPQMMLVAGAIALLAIALALIAAAMLIFTIAVAAMGPAIISLVGGLTAFADASDKIVASVPAMLGIGAGLIVFGLGAAIAGIGIGILGLALVIMGAGLALIGAVGIIGATALTAVALAIVNLVQYAAPLTLMAVVLSTLGVGLLAVGVGGILAGLGLIIVGAGVLLIAAAFMVLAPALDSVSGALQRFIPHVETFVEAVPGMIALGAGLLAFGAGAGAAGLGILLLGAGLVVLALGLTMIEDAGTKGAKVIKKVAEEVAGLWGHALNIGIIAAALLGLGGALLVLGAGMILVGGGAFIVVGALMAFIGISAGFSAAGALVIQTIQNLVNNVPKMGQAVTSITLLTGAIGKFGGTSLLAAAGVSAITIAFAALTSASTTMGSTVLNTATIVASSMQRIITSVGLVPPAVKTMTTNVQTAMDVLSTIVDRASLNVSAGMTRLANTIKSTVSSAVASAKATADSGGSGIGTAITDGMVRGLNNGSSKVASAARSVAKTALAAAKKELDSHSPSKKFIKLGEDSDQGFAMGFEGKAHIVAKAAAGVGTTAMHALKKSISDISNAVAIDPNMRPTITPILDLSQFKKDVPQISRALNSHNLDVASTFDDANVISLNADAELRGAQPGNVTNVNFTQVNNSPKALSDAEIYRQTNNQVARLKKGVGASDVD